MLNLSILSLLRNGELFSPNLNPTIELISPQNISDNEKEKPFCESPMRLHPTIPKLALKNLYWRCCLTCYTLGCSRPSTLGKFLWNNVPSVQSLMLMSMSGQFATNSFVDQTTTDMIEIGEISKADEDSLMCEGQGEELLSYLPSEKVSISNPDFGRSCARATAWKFVGTRKKIIVGGNCVSVEKGYPFDVETTLNELEYRLAITLFAPGSADSIKEPKRTKKSKWKDRNGDQEPPKKPLKFNKDGSIRVETRGRKRKHVSPCEPAIVNKLELPDEIVLSKRLKVENSASKLNETGFSVIIKYFIRVININFNYFSDKI